MNLIPIAVLFLCSFGFAIAQTTPAAKDLQTAAQYPAPVQAIEIEGGHRYDYRTDGRSESYHRISYKGQLLSGEGAPFKYATGLDLSAPAVTVGAGDQSDWSFRYEKQSATVGGGLFEAIGVQPFSVRAPEWLKLRGTGFAGGDADGKKTQLAIGVETAPFRVPGFKKTQASNWIVFGINAQRQEATDTAEGDKNFGLFTYRAFVGQGFFWRRSADAGKTAAKIAETFLAQAPTYAAATELVTKMEDEIGTDNLTNLQIVFYDTYYETNPDDDEDWKRRVQAAAIGKANAIADQPTLAVYAETSGWYAVTKPPEGSRFKNLLTITMDYWLLPKRDDIFLRLRYENGFERALLTVRKNHLLLAAGIKF